MIAEMNIISVDFQRQWSQKTMGSMYPGLLEYEFADLIIDAQIY